MPHLQIGESLPLPFGGRSPRARRCSLAGARIAVLHAESQASRIMGWYFDRGPLTDLELGRLTGLPESRVSARRGGLMAKGLIQWIDDVTGPCGAPNGRYDLTAKGRNAVLAMRRQNLAQWGIP